MVPVTSLYGIRGSRVCWGSRTSEDWTELQNIAARTTWLRVSDQVVYHVMDLESPREI
jgi:hypothetical protein